jgi:hypothetical protein
MPVVESAARLTLTASSEGEERRSVLSMHRKLTRREPFDMKEEGRVLAAAVLEAEGYPFE